jgi:hypothetical protein
LGPVTVACEGEEARLAWASGTASRGEPENALWFARCSRAGCTTETSRVTGLSVKKLGLGTWGATGESRVNFVESPTVFDLGDRAMLLWDAGDAVLFRAGPKAALQTAEDHVLVESYRPWVTKVEVPGAAAIAFHESSFVVREKMVIGLLVEDLHELVASHRMRLLPVRIGADSSVRAMPCD